MPYFTEWSIILNALCVMCLAAGYVDIGTPNLQTCAPFMTIYAMCSILNAAAKSNSILPSALVTNSEGLPVDEIPSRHKAKLLLHQNDLDFCCSPSAWLIVSLSFCLLSSFYGFMSAFWGLGSMIFIFVIFYLMIDSELELMEDEDRLHQRMHQQNLSDDEECDKQTTFGGSNSSGGENVVFLKAQPVTPTPWNMLCATYSALSSTDKRTSEQSLCKVASLAFWQSAYSDGLVKCLPVLIVVT